MAEIMAGARCTPSSATHSDFGDTGNHSCEYMIITGEYC
jgi:hypothetical protein